MPKKGFERIAALLGVSGVVIAGVLFRCRFFHEPVRVDEAYSMLRYASQPLSMLVADYSAFNNHLLHSIAMHFTYQWFGLSDLGLRLPAFLAGISVLGLMIWLAWELTGNLWVVFLTALWGSASYPLIYYSVNGRGYSMQMMFTLGVAITLLRAASWPSPLWAILLAALNLFGLLYTIQSGIVIALPLLVGGLVLAGLHRNKAWALYTLLAFSICGLMLLIAWGPGLKAMIAQAGGAKAPVSSVLLSAFYMLSDGVLPAWLCGLALLAGFWNLSRRNADAARLMAIVLFGYPVLLVMLGHWLPLPVMYGRSYTPLFPLAYVMMALGIEPAARGLRRYLFGYRLPLLALCTSGLVIYAAHAAFLVLRDPARLYFPERPTMEAGRVLISPLARSLQKGETVTGTGSLCDMAAAYYIIQARGFHGFYSLFEPQKRGIHTVYVLTEDPASAQDTWKNVSVWARWTTPEKIAASGNVSLFRMTIADR